MDDRVSSRWRFHIYSVVWDYGFKEADKAFMRPMKAELFELGSRFYDSEHFIAHGIEH